MSHSHGDCRGGKTSEYYRWRAMKDRCLNPRNKDYRHYGGRGITICERWFRFENFLCDMGRCPKGMTLERKDTNKGYSPENCIWAPWQAQQQNTRKNVFITAFGKTQHLSAWARELGIPVVTIFQRMKVGFPPSLWLVKGRVPYGSPKIAGVPFTEPRFRQ